MKRDEVVEVLILLSLCLIQLWWVEKPIIVPFIFLTILASFLTREEEWLNFGLGSFTTSLTILVVFIFIYGFKKIEMISG